MSPTDQVIQYRRGLKDYLKQATVWNPRTGAPLADMMTLHNFCVSAEQAPKSKQVAHAQGERLVNGRPFQKRQRIGREQQKSGVVRSRQTQWH
jgi:hypothetical protein